MPNPYSVVVTVGSVVTGPGTQPSLQFSADQFELTWSWGLQPARGLISWVNAQPLRDLLSSAPDPTVTPKALLTISGCGHVFYGFCESAVQTIGSDGFSLMQEFVDMRELLQWGLVFGAFNIRDTRIVNGERVRRYKHILPANAATRTETYTAAPYTAVQILDMLFLAPSTLFPWTRVYHPAMEAPIYEFDCMSGKKLGAAIVEISNKFGLTFTMMGGQWNLVWTLKGVGTLPDFPPNSDNRRRGQKISGNPTAVQMLGDRNLYQVMNIPMQKDWAVGYEAFWDFNAFVRDIFLYEKTEAQFGSIAAGTAYTAIDAGNENNAGYLLARARAETITVGEYADLVEARYIHDPDYQPVWRDYRRYANQSRLSMPVSLYLSQVLYRAFRFAPGFSFRNAYGQYVGLTALEVVERSLAQITHDPATGAMFYDPVLPSQPNGYAIIQGYQVAQDAFKTLHPEYFNIENWVGSQAVWQAASFHIDNSGEGDQFIVFENPVIASGDLLAKDATGSYSGFNAAAKITVPAVRVALTFAAENLRWFAGTGTRVDVENVSGLHGEFICLEPGSAPVEIPFPDGFTSFEKMAQLAAPLINRQFYYDYGGYTVQGSNGTQLSAMIDRVTLSSSADGTTERVDFTTERSRNVAFYGNRIYVQTEPDRDFDRRSTLAPLLPGQAELRSESNQLRAEAALLLKNPRLSRRLTDTFHLLLGLDSVPDQVMLQSPPTGATLPLGTPLFRDGAGQNPYYPNNGGSTSITDPVFMGATVARDEKADGPVRVTRLGGGGVIFVRAQGPVTVNAALGVATDKSGNPVAKDYLVTGGAANSAAVATALEAIGDSSIKLIRATVMGAGGGTTCPFG